MKLTKKIIDGNNLKPPIDIKKIIEGFGIPIIIDKNGLDIEAFSELSDSPKIHIVTSDLDNPSRDFN